MFKYVIFMLLWWSGTALFTSCPDPVSSGAAIFVSEKPVSDGDGIDKDFLASLSSAGVFDAARQIGLAADKYLIPLAKSVDHNYRRYRWSVGYHESGGIMISAFPPEEESGWTPWEIWYKDKQGVTRRESWVLYPLKDSTHSGFARWYKLEEEGLMPRYLHKPDNLQDQLRRARIYDAAKVLGIDAEALFIKPLSEAAKSYYQQCRWVVIPHILAQGSPVIYILPPMSHSDNWPWESWYSDGKIKLIHHVHFTRENKLTKAAWKEYPGAPQRPPEIFGVVWYWYDDLELRPSMADLK